MSPVPHRAFLFTFRFINIRMAMKQLKHLFTALLLTSMAFMLSCGDAGVQIKVGDEYATSFPVVGLNLLGTLDPPAQSTEINQDLLDYGDYIKDIQVKSVVISFENVETPFIGQFNLNISGQSFSSGNTTISNTSSIEAISINLVSLQSILQNGEVSIDFDISSSDVNIDDNFDFIVSLEVFAIVQAD